MILFTARAYLSARQREFAQHREWMSRSFSIGLGIATIRIFYRVGIAATSLTSTQLVGVTFWSGWLVTMAHQLAMVTRGRRRDLRRALQRRRTPGEGVASVSWPPCWERARGHVVKALQEAEPEGRWQAEALRRVLGA
jgi:hypothetical protein